MSIAHGRGRQLLTKSGASRAVSQHRGRHLDRDLWHARTSQRHDRRPLLRPRRNAVAAGMRFRVTPYLCESSRELEAKPVDSLSVHDSRIVECSLGAPSAIMRERKVSVGPDSDEKRLTAVTDAVGGGPTAPHSGLPPLGRGLPRPRPRVVSGRPAQNRPSAGRCMTDRRAGGCGGKTRQPNLGHSSVSHEAWGRSPLRLAGWETCFTRSAQSSRDSARGEMQRVDAERQPLRPARGVTDIRWTLTRLCLAGRRSSRAGLGRRAAPGLAAEAGQ